jgi:hypothetical protein
LRADSSAKPGRFTVTITGRSGSLSHSGAIDASLIATKKGSVPLDLSSAYNKHGIYEDGSKFPASASMDGQGFAYSAQLLGSAQPWNGISFKLGPPNNLNAVTSRDLPLPAAKFLSLNMLATGVGGNQEDQIFTVTYEDGSHSDFTQSLSDWYTPESFPGEFPAVKMPYRVIGSGGKDERTFYLYAYSFDLDSTKAIRSLSLPDNEAALVFAISLEPALR